MLRRAMAPAHLTLTIDSTERRCGIPAAHAANSFLASERRLDKHDDADQYLHPELNAVAPVHINVIIDVPFTHDPPLAALCGRDPSRKYCNSTPEPGENSSASKIKSGSSTHPQWLIDQRNAATCRTRRHRSDRAISTGTTR